MEQIASRQLSDFKAVQDIRAARFNPDDGYSESRVKNRIAIIDVMGPIFARAGWFDKISGAVDVEALAGELNMALENPDIEGIILHIDSPGGEVSGTSDLARMVAEGRSRKKIYAYVQGSAASGAYWLASSADKIYMADTAMVGSIGVVMGYRDEKEKDAKAGVKNLEIVSSQSPYKRLDPDTSEGRTKVQETVDSIAEVFVQTVARNRNVSAETVTKEFGQGWMKVGTDAVRLRMADGIGTLDSVMALMKTQSKGAFSMSGENKETPPKTAAEETSALENAVSEALKAERSRIQSIEALKPDWPAHAALIDKLKMQDGMTPEKVSMAILEAEKTSRQAKANATSVDALAVAEATANAGAALPSGGDEDKRKALVSIFIQGANNQQARRNALPKQA
jgi:signal peptide peptidase SppA